jgi:transcriptional regulator with XRE-family HTH domain
MKTFELELRLRNNLLKSRRVQAGMKGKEVAAACGMSAVTYYRLEGLRAPLRTKKGEWRFSVLRLADYYGVLPEELFPPEVEAVVFSRLFKEIGREELPPAILHEPLALPPMQEDEVFFHESQRIVRDALDQLARRSSCDARGVEWLRLYYGIDVTRAMTLQQIADLEGITCSAVDLVIKRTLRRLRHPSLTVKLWPVARDLG